MALTSEISSLTHRFLIPKLVDNIFQSNILFQRAKKKGWYNKVDGGTKATQPLAYATTSNAMRFTGSDTLTITDNQQITDAEWDWTQYAVSIQITRLDELKNSGKSAIISHLKSKTQLAEKSLADLLGTDLFSDGTTSKSFQGIKLMTAATGTYGGLSKNTYSWWQGQVDSTTSALSPNNLNALIGDCRIDSEYPTVIVTTQDMFDDLFNGLQPQQRFSDDETFKAGYRNLVFNGIPVIVDSHCDSGYLYALNEDYMAFKVLEDFRFSPFIKPTNMAVKVAQIFWCGALTASNCRMMGVMNSLV